MNREASYRNEDTDPLNVNGITFEFSVDNEETELSTGPQVPIRTFVASTGKTHLSEIRERGPPPQTLTRENSSSTKNSQSTRGSTDSEGSLGNRQGMHIGVQGRQLHQRGNATGKRSSMSTPTTIPSSVSSVVITERSETSFNSGFLGRADN
jgi:hypothetical protein